MADVTDYFQVVSPDRALSFRVTELLPKRNGCLDKVGRDRSVPPS